MKKENILSVVVLRIFSGNYITVKTSSNNDINEYMFRI